MCSVFGSECSETWYLKRLKWSFSRCDLVVTISRKLIFLLKALLTILGFLVFLFSIILPFYAISMGSGFYGSSTQYWSYESHGHYGRMSGQSWFSDYWFNPYMVIGLGIPWILVSMFTIQVLTLLFGAASIIFNRRMLSSAPVLLSLLAIALMLYTGMMEETYSGKYQLGFYLAFPSLILFLSAFALSEVIKKRQTSKPMKEN